MNATFETLEENIQWTTEQVPLTVCYVEENSVKTRLLHIPLRHCESLQQTAVIENASSSSSSTVALVDRTGLFIWRGTREFIQLFSIFCQAYLKRWVSLSASAAPSLPSMPFERAVELGAGGGLGTLAVGACSACWRGGPPSSSSATTTNVVHCVATDYWLNSLQWLLVPSRVELLEQLQAQQAEVTAPAQVAFYDTLIETIKSIEIQTLDWILCMNGGPHSPSSPHTTGALDFLSSNEGGARTWFYGLDILYPDTRHAVLLSLFGCMRRCLPPPPLHTDTIRERNETPFDLFRDCVWSSFVERDGGETLVRLVTAAVLMGLEVWVLASPFHSLQEAEAVLASLPPPSSPSSSSPCALRSALPLLLMPLEQHDSPVTLEAFREATWRALGEGVQRCIQTHSLHRTVTSRGSWLFAFRPLHHKEINDTLIDEEERFHLDAMAPRLVSALLAGHSEAAAVLRRIEESPYWRPLREIMPWIFTNDENNKNYRLTAGERAQCCANSSRIRSSSTTSSVTVSLSKEKMKQIFEEKQKLEKEKEELLFNGFELF